MNKWYRIALRLLRESNHPKHKMAAILVRGGTILSTSLNRPRWGCHAERPLCSHPKANGGTVVVAREGGRMSRPCAVCLTMLKGSGISKVAYANWSGELVIENL